ncbi:major histocompatibility complex class I-related gene protein-like [Pituophis catenifer annectens]|uniref:major histocompatibility complex class I-related gene protein-like n=1 Tax=Pituophis catenifer annectens TaxID=94852 RepID=UPI0039944C4C
MGLPVTALGLLSAAAVLVLRGRCGEGCAGSSSHSLYLFYTLFVDSNQDGAQYIVAYVDNQLVARFDPTTRRTLPQVAWLHNVTEEDSHFWDTISWTVNITELTFRNELRIYHNSSKGFHSWQNLIGCKLSDEGQKQGTYQYGYDGEDFISLDQKTLSWVAVNVHAQEIKRQWEAEPLIAHSWNDYLEEKCIEFLQKCVMYGKDSLLRKEPPVAEVSHTIQYKGLVCQVYGFYPKEVNVTWREDGEIRTKNTSSSGVLPNSDGTYYTSLSIKVDPEDKRDHYRCYVEHAGLSEPLIVAWEEPVEIKWDYKVWIIVGVVAVAFILVMFCFAVKRFGVPCREILAKCFGAKGREILATSRHFELHPVLRDQDQRQQDQDQRQQRTMMEDFERTQTKARTLRPLWNLY